MGLRATTGTGTQFLELGTRDRVQRIQIKKRLHLLKISQQYQAVRVKLLTLSSAKMYGTGDRCEKWGLRKYISFRCEADHSRAFKKEHIQEGVVQRRIVALGKARFSVD